MRSDGNNQIRRITPAGKVETIPSFVDATTRAAFDFKGIHGLAVNKKEFYMLPIITITAFAG